MHVYEVRPRKDRPGYDLIFDGLPFGGLWYTEPDDAIEYAKFRSRSDNVVIRVYHEVGNVIETVRRYKATTIESVYLQFRKILELIALGSLVANKGEFSKVYNDFAKYWNARSLLRDLERLNANFYPRPIVEVPSKRPRVKMDLQDKKDGFLSKDEFLKLYQKCGAIMHAGNPYGSQVDYEYYERNIQGWLDKVIGLLNSHTIRLVNDPKLYVVHMHEDRDDKVHHYVFEPTTTPKPAI